MTPTTFYAPKGGQGCTSMAYAYALTRAEVGSVHLVSSQPDHLASMAGIPTPPEGEPFELAPGIRVNDPALRGVHSVIIDAGTVTHKPAGPAVMVVRPCYVALRAAVAIHARSAGPDAAIIIEEHGRALSQDDARDTILCPTVAGISADTALAIARAIDAGILGQRLPRALRIALALVATVEGGAPCPS